MCCRLSVAADGKRKEAGQVYVESWNLTHANG